MVEPARLGHVCRVTQSGPAGSFFSGHHRDVPPLVHVSFIPALAQHLYDWMDSARVAAGIPRKKGERLHVMRRCACSDGWLRLHRRFYCFEIVASENATLRSCRKGEKMGEHVHP
jgi:hypothetical protein